MKKINLYLLQLIGLFILVSSSTELLAECRRDTIKYYEYQNGTRNKILTSRKVSTFNASNLPTLELTQDWDSVGKIWKDDQQIIRVYDNNWNLTSELNQSWWPSLTKWVNSSRETNTYNTMNKIITNVLEYHNGSAWVNDTRISRAYDTDGNEIEYKKEEWSTGSNQWENKSKSIRTWAVNNRQLTSISQTWDDMGNKWVNRSKYQPSYDGNGNWILGLYEAWDNNTSQWLNDRKTVLTYDGNDNRLTRESLNWDENTSKWVSSTKLTYYFVNNKRMSDLNEKWVSNAWENVDRYTYTYNGDLVSGYVKEIWSANVWVNNRKKAFTYNINDDKTIDITQYWISNAWVNNSLNTFIYNNDNDLSGREQFYAWQTSGMFYGGFAAEYYSCTTYVGVEPITNERGVLLYPNPAKYSITLKSNTPIQNVEVYNYNGQLLIQTDSKNIDLKQLDAGTYMVKIRTKTGTSTQKLVIEK